jgi:hypothetical protein
MPVGIAATRLTNWQGQLARGHTATWLKTVIVLWALFVIVLVVFFVDSPWLLAGILLYEVLP